MPLEKIGQEDYPCLDPQHNPPTNIVLDPGGIYEYTCPFCGKKTVINEEKCPRCGGTGQIKNGREICCACCLAILYIE